MFPRRRMSRREALSVTFGASGFASGPAFRPSGRGVFRPGVPGITDPQFFADARIGVGPKTGKVIRDLLRAVARGEQVKKDIHPTTGQARSLPPAEDLLNADF